MKQASSAEKQSCPSLCFQGGTGTQGISRSLCKRDRQRYLLRVLVCHPPCVSRYLKPNFFLSVQCSFFVLVVSLKTQIHWKSARVCNLLSLILQTCNVCAGRLSDPFCVKKVNPSRLFEMELLWVMKHVVDYYLQALSDFEHFNLNDCFIYLAECSQWSKESSDP